MPPIPPVYAIRYGVREGVSGWVVHAVRPFGLEDLSAPQTSAKDAEKWLAEYVVNINAAPVYYNANGKALT